MRKKFLEEREKVTWAKKRRNEEKKDVKKEGEKGEIKRHTTG